MVEKNHEHCIYCWTRHGTDDILVRSEAEGVLREYAKRLDPDGCLVQQAQNNEDAAKAAKAQAEKTKNWFCEGGGNFVKKLAGRGSFS